MIKFLPYFLVRERLPVQLCNMAVLCIQLKWDIPQKQIFAIFVINTSIWYLPSAAGKERNIREILKNPFKLSPSRCILQEHQFYSELYWFFIFVFHCGRSALDHLVKYVDKFTRELFQLCTTCLTLKATVWICTCLWRIT